MKKEHLGLGRTGLPSAALQPGPVSAKLVQEKEER